MMSVITQETKMHGENGSSTKKDSKLIRSNISKL